MSETSTGRVVAAIGVFDGIHLGHQVLLKRVRESAAREGVLTGAITFDPPPLALLARCSEPFQVTPPREKLGLLAEMGIQRLLLLRFTRQLAALPPRRFLENILLHEFDLTGIVIGHDFRFGARREGDVRLLRSVGTERGFWVEEVAAVEEAGERVSSTRLREYIRLGRVSKAARLLGRVLTVEGEVVAGSGVGGRLLMPTANLEVEPSQLLPAVGVYVIEAQVGGARFAGVANVGPAPTLGTGHDRLIEVHLLDYEGNLRGRRIRVGFLEWLREGKRFPNLQSLRAAIGADIDAARRRLAPGLDNRLAPCIAV